MVIRHFYFISQPYVLDSSGYVARESVRVANLTVPDQAFGIEPDFSAAFRSIFNPLFCQVSSTKQLYLLPTRSVESWDLAFLDFPGFITLLRMVRSSFSHGVPNSFLRWLVIGTPFFSSLAQQGIVDYPIFGIYLTRNSTGTLSLGQSTNTAITITRRLTILQVPSTRG